jgi:hypothetical protein
LSFGGIREEFSDKSPFTAPNGGILSPQVEAALVIIAFALVSLVISFILFKFLRNFARVRNKNYSFGGAIAGWIAAFVLMGWWYGRLRPGAAIESAFAANSAYVTSELFYIVDMRARQPGTSDHKTSPVTVERRDVVNKVRETTEPYTTFYGTSGFEVEWKGVTPPDRGSFNEIRGGPFARPMKHSYNLVYDLKEYPVSFQHSIVLLNRFVFWNGFQGEREDFWSSEAPYPTERMVVVLMFPEIKPCTKMTLSKRTGDTNPILIEDSPVRLTQGNKIAYWSATNVEKGTRYIFHWEW